MGNIFTSSTKRKKRKKGISEADRAVLDLKNARDRLRRYQTKLERENEELASQAIGLLRLGKKERAVLVVKLRRIREKKLGDIDGQLLTLEQMVNTIEWETQQATVVASLRQGTDALNAMHAVMTVESIEELLEDTRAAQEKAESISEALAAVEPQLSAAREAEVAIELEELERSLEVVPSLPVAPTTEPVLVRAEVAEAPVVGERDNDDLKKKNRVAIPAS